MTEIDPYEEYQGPRTPKGFCPLCLSPERKGGMRASNHIPYECGTTAVASGMRLNKDPETMELVDYWTYHRNAYQIGIGDQCFRNVVEKRNKHGQL